MIQDAMHWINLRKAQAEGFQLWQTRSYAIIFYDSVPADSIERVVNTKTKESFVSESFQLHVRFPKIFGSLAGPTRRFSSAWYWHWETSYGRGKERAEN